MAKRPPEVICLLSGPDKYTDYVIEFIGALPNILYPTYSWCQTNFPVIELYFCRFERLFLLRPIQEIV
jgi:hypothetical protein